MDRRPSDAAYAAGLRFPTAVLVYPQASDYDHARAGGIEVHRLASSLDRLLAPAGSAGAWGERVLDRVHGSLPSL